MLAAIDVLSLARAQFAFTISFHIVFPAFSIGLASYLAVLESLWLCTEKDVYRKLFDFWKKVFAVVFGMGVVSGLVMSYEFGTNWSVFSEKAGPVIGPLMGYEVFSAFFLEAGFLGVMLFGAERVGKRLDVFHEDRHLRHGLSPPRLPYRHRPRGKSAAGCRLSHLGNGRDRQALQRHEQVRHPFREGLAPTHRRILVA